MVGVTNASPRIQSTFRLDEVSGSAEGKLQAAALADQVQIVTPDTAQPPLAIQLPERAREWLITTGTTGCVESQRCSAGASVTLGSSKRRRRPALQLRNSSSP